MSSLDSAYIDWLRDTTTRLWPIIRDGHFALHTYHTNFNLGKKDIDKADEKEKEIGVLCDKYGPLYSNIAFAKVDEEAWVTSYRQKYRYDGDDMDLLELMAEAFEEIRNDLIRSDQRKTANLSSTPIIHNASRDPEMAEANTKSQNEYLEAMRKSQQTNGPNGQHMESRSDDGADEDDAYEHDRYEQENSLRGEYGRHGYGGWD